MASAKLVDNKIYCQSVLYLHETARDEVKKMNLSDKSHKVHSAK